jgi:hypothetical protein
MAAPTLRLRRNPTSEPVDEDDVSRWKEVETRVWTILSDASAVEPSIVKTSELRRSLTATFACPGDLRVTAFVDSLRRTFPGSGVTVREIDTRAADEPRHLEVEFPKSYFARERPMRMIRRMGMAVPVFVVVCMALYVIVVRWVLPRLGRPASA